MSMRTKMTSMTWKIQLEKHSWGSIRPIKDGSKNFWFHLFKIEMCVEILMG